MRVLVLGAGGHGQVVADILLEMGRAGSLLAICGYLDDDPALTGQSLLGVPVLGPMHRRASVPHDAVIIGVGCNRTRERLASELISQGEHFATACHPRAVIASDVIVGPGTAVCAAAVVNTGCVIGSHAILNTGCTVDHHNVINDYAHVAPGAHLGGSASVGIGALVGIGAIVSPQRAIGDWAVIGAGGVVIKDIPPQVTAMGVPASVRRDPAVPRD